MMQLLNECLLAGQTLTVSFPLLCRLISVTVQKFNITILNISKLNQDNLRYLINYNPIVPVLRQKTSLRSDVSDNESNYLTDCLYRKEFLLNMYCIYYCYLIYPVYLLQTEIITL